MRKHGSQIKNDRTDEALREQGTSKTKATRGSNAKATGHTPGKKRTPESPSGRTGMYEHWNKDELLAKANQVGIRGRSKMNKRELAKALREH